MRDTATHDKFLGLGQMSVMARDLDTKVLLAAELGVSTGRETHLVPWRSQKSLKGQRPQMDHRPPKHQ